MGISQHLISALWHTILAEAHSLGAWSYLLLGLVVMVEGPTATLLGAIAASAGALQLPLVFLAAALGNLTGDILWYSLGRHGSLQWLERHGRWFGLNGEKMADLERLLRANAPRIIFLAKITLIFAVPALVTAGILRIRWRRWFFVDVAAECLWTGTLALLGYYLSGYIARLEQGVQVAGIVGCVLLGIALIALARRYGSRWKRHATSALPT
jgi:membrane protein DedA with SNARE-associated domain